MKFILIRTDPGDPIPEFTIECGDEVVAVSIVKEKMNVDFDEYGFRLSFSGGDYVLRDITNLEHINDMI